MSGPALVLVVDDDEDIVDLLRFKLESIGLDVVTATDGVAGLAAARTRRPDLVLLDWMMPELSGLEVLTAMRADAALAATPVVLLTARSQDDDIARGAAAGATDHVVKPFVLADLAARVRGLLAAG